MKYYGQDYGDIPYNDDIDDIEYSTCSTYDCTGLIPSAITNAEQAEAYEDLYPYLPDTDDTHKEYGDYRHKF